jgi:hypothetical protein
MRYKRKEPIKLTGQEVFKNTNNKNFSVLEFWQYGFSNLNSNVLRGALAEFLVEKALSEDGNIGIRNPWGDYDVLTKGGVKIEVKCCSYIQDWDQEKLSTIKFSGLKARELYWSPEIKEFNKIKSDPKGYKADIYILALFKHQSVETLDILDLNQWCFYVLSKEEISRISKNSSSISLSALEKNNIQPVLHVDLRRKLEKFESKEDKTLDL